MTDANETADERARERPAESSDETLARSFAEIARALLSESSTEDTLHKIVQVAVRTVEGAEHAGVSLVHRHGKIDTPAFTDHLVLQCDSLQYEAGEGPCLDAIWEHETFEIDDMADETRWPRYTPDALDIGVRSLLAFRLFSKEDTLGALNLYSRKPHAFTRQSREVGQIFAVHAAGALAAAQKQANLEEALKTREIIGQAQGILMERDRLTAEQAFDVLRRASQDLNVKLREVAERVTTTGEEPPTSPHRPG